MITRSSFYKSDAWQKFRRIIISQRMDDKGAVHCALCGKALLKTRDIQVDHIQELTDDNYQDVNVSLNPDNVQILCIDCHNKKHERFQGWQAPKPKKVYIIWGSPCAGKNTYVSQHAGKNDLIVDMDRLWEAVSTQDRYHKPDRLKGIVFDLRENLYDAVKHRHGKWQDAYIIVTAPLTGDRERLKERVYADELIHIDTDRETCLSRAQTEEWKELINNYFDRLQA